MNYTIRLAIAEDLPFLEAIELAAATIFPEEDLSPFLRTDATTMEEYQAALDVGLLWVAADDANKPVGFAHLVPMNEHIHLEELDVHPDHGRKGLGRRLVKTVLSWAREHGYPSVTLTTFRHIPWNAPFYNRLGFRHLAENELSDELREELDWEELHGLERSKRVAMRRDL